ncbi:MAG: hypothetical protein H6608_05925 [Flavobacteriales bacterium]|nr:hypothetical protein [Flavobacteriales bacterium]
MTATKLLIFSFFTLAVKICDAQIIRDYDLSPVESVVIPDANDEKIHLFVFLKKGHAEAESLKQLMNALRFQMDQDNIVIHRINVNDLQVCVPGKSIELDGWKLIGYPAYVDYLILVNTAYPDFQKLLNERCGATNGRDLTLAVFRNENGQTPFGIFKDSETFFRFVLKPQINAVSEEYYIQEMIRRDSLINHLILKTDSLEMDTKKPSYYVSFQIMPKFMATPVIRGHHPDFATISSKRFQSFQLNFTQLTGRNKKAGLTIGLGLSHHSIELGMKHNTSWIDTLPEGQIDQNGDPYIGIIHMQGLRETLELKSAFAFFGWNYNMVLPISVRNGHCGLRVLGGLSFHSIVKSRDVIRNGTVSYSGYYPQYHNGTTLFNGSYGFFADKPVYNYVSQFRSRDSYISGSMEVMLKFPLNTFQTWHAMAGLFAACNSSILQRNQESELDRIPKEHSAPSLLNTYHEFRLLPVGFKFGLVYVH